MNSISHIIPAGDQLSIVDIGASMTGDESPTYQALIDAGKARLFAFEPDPVALATLRNRYPPPHVCLPHFVGDGRRAILYETNWGPTGSLFEPNTRLLERFQNLAEVTTLVATHEVATVRLDDIAEIDDVDHIKIDAQGSEHMIFQNAPRRLENCMIIQTEVNFVELYKGAPLASDIDHLLRSAGFQWHMALGFGYRPFKPFANRAHPQQAFRQQLWGDVVYVRDWDRFAGIPPAKLIKLAVLLHDLYQSYDLAHLAFETADHQGGTRYAPDYSEWMIGNAGNTDLEAVGKAVT